MSSALPPDGSSLRPFAEKTTEEVDASVEGRVLDERQKLLDDVLQATLQLSSAGAAAGADEMRTLLALARRRKDVPFSRETVVELVETILRWRFRHVVESSSVWERMTRQIADTVFDDPRTHDRVQAFWQRLCEAAT